MKRKIIKAIVYNHLDEELGPNPKAFLPTDFSQLSLMHISVKTFAVLTGERGLIPDSLVVLPFPSLQLKGLIKYIQWEDPEKRGGVGHSNLAIFFEETDDVIFYKYMQELSRPFNDIVQNIEYLEKSKASDDEFVNELKNLENTIGELLEELKSQELMRSKVEALPVHLTDRSLIDYQFKIIVVGEPTVGKTSLILRYTDNAFRRAYVSTLGVHVSNKVFKTEDSAIIQLVLWDIGGQEKFKLMRKQFYQGSDALFLVFDLTNPDSFATIPNWYADIKEQLSIPDNEIMGFLVGNKKDLKEEIKINLQNAKELAESINLKYVETSALSGENVDDAFTTLAKILYKSRI
ncbi:MAG: Rab family GTPase [Promethearchaeota archaeon]|jgi:Ras-related protein Rab-1A